MFTRTRVLAAVAILLSASAFAGGSMLHFALPENITPGLSPKYRLSTEGISEVKVSIHKLPGSAVLLYRDSPLARKPKELGKLVRQESVSFPKAKKGGFQSREMRLPVLGEGTYLVSARGGGRDEWQIVNVTAIAAVAKSSSQRTLVWVTDATTGRTVKGAKVTVFLAEKPAASGVTGADGTAVVATRPKSDQRVLVRSGKSAVALGCGVESRDGQKLGLVQTDRPVYRPGQTVSFKAIIRRIKGNGYTAVANTPVSVEAHDSRDNTVFEAKLSTNALGTLSGEFELPEKAGIGQYSISVDDGSAWFKVEEYRKPEFLIKVSPQKKRYMTGERGAFDVAAKYYFGAPLKEAKVGYSVFQEVDHIYASGEPLWNYDRRLVAQGEAWTDQDGRASIAFATKESSRDATYTVECAIVDTQERAITEYAMVPVHPSAARITVSTDVCTAPLGSVVPISLRVVDLDGKPVGGKVVVSIRKPVWDKKLSRSGYKEVGRTLVTLPASGKMTTDVSAAAEGRLVIAAKVFDASGRASTDETEVWVVGPQDRMVVERERGTISIQLGRRTYAPGNTVSAWITTADSHRPMLVTFEGRDLWRSVVVPAGKKSVALRFATDTGMSPNATISAFQWTKEGEISQTAEVKIPDPARKLSVKMEPEKACLLPGEGTRCRLQTTDSAGKPIPAEVALAVVDESVFAIERDHTSDLYTSLWQSRWNEVRTWETAPLKRRLEYALESYAVASAIPKMKRLMLPPKPLADRAAQMVKTRQNFADTALWRAHVLTDEDGRAVVDFDMPDNLTTWRATARGITLDSRAGSALGSIQTSRPVMLRLSVPRQMVQGDRLKLLGVVNNTSDQAHTFAASLDCDGLTVLGESARTIEVGAGAEASVAWEIAADKLPEGGLASLSAQVVPTDAPGRIGELSDALKVDLKVVPNGVARRIVEGGTLKQQSEVTLTLPADRIEPATVARVKLSAGLGELVSDMAEGVFDSGIADARQAADWLTVCAATGKKRDSRETREALAVLSRNRSPEGYGWGQWDGASVPDVALTAHVLAALARAKASGINCGQSLGNMEEWGAELLDSAEYPDLKARVTASYGLAWMVFHDVTDGIEKPEGTVSPFGELCLAEAFAANSMDDQAAQSLELGLKNLVVGPDMAFVQAGERVGWEASTVETTAQALLGLMWLDRDPELQTKLVRWLADPNESRNRSSSEAAAAAWALSSYARKHPQPAEVGKVEIVVNGQKIDGTDIPRSALRDGENRITLKRNGGGEVFYSVDAEVYRPADAEACGVRIFRRYDHMKPSGVWDELAGAVKAGETLRCTVLVWPDDREEPIRVVEPIPSGFEYVGTDESEWCRDEEVRDGAVVHYLAADGRPITFRYYLRAESEGTLTALPASAEATRRPEVRSNTAAQWMEIVGK